jgi:hypothetical protein
MFLATSSISFALFTLLQVYDCLQRFKEKKLVPDTTHAQILACEVRRFSPEEPESPC